MKNRKKILAWIVLIVPYLFILHIAYNNDINLFYAFIFIPVFFVWVKAAIYLFDPR